MKKLNLTLVLIATVVTNHAQLTAYFDGYRKEGTFDYQTEQNILATVPCKKILKKLSAYYTDTLLTVRRQAYYLSYRAGQQAEPKDKERAVHILLQGCTDGSKQVSGRCLSHLKNFPVTAFDKVSKIKIDQLLRKDKMPHFRELCLLAVYTPLTATIF